MTHRILFAFVAGLLFPALAQADKPRVQTRPGLSVRSTRLQRRSSKTSRDLRNKARACRRICRSIEQKARAYRRQTQQHQALSRKRPQLRRTYASLVGSLRTLTRHYGKMTVSCRRYRSQLQAAARNVLRNPRGSRTILARLKRTENRLKASQRRGEGLYAAWRVKVIKTRPLIRRKIQKIKIQRKKPRMGLEPAGPTGPRFNNRPGGVRRNQFGKQPQLTINRITVNAGRRYQSRLRQLLQAQKSAFVRCVTKSKRATGGNYSFALRIRSDGRLVSSRAARWPSTGFGAAICMRNHIRKLRYPLPPQRITQVELSMSVRPRR